jgi:uncharacterized protein YecE (DUF72 family)
MVVAKVTILCGTCAWADHELFYPKSVKPSERLAYYAQFFQLVEIDSSFYGIPSPSIVKQWVMQTPANFTFDIKAFRSLTLHDRGDGWTDQRSEDVSHFAEAVSVLEQSGRLGSVLLQFPPWFVKSETHQNYLVQLVERLHPFRLALEFRHRSWWQGDSSGVIEWMKQMRVVNVVCDEPQIGMGTIPFRPEITNSQFVVFRLHGRNAVTWYDKGLSSSMQRFDYKYSREELSALVPYVREWSQSAQDVHILMNNNQSDYAITNAFDWFELLQIPHKKRVPIENTKQLSLFDSH